MNQLRVTLLIFVWSIPFLLLLGGISLFNNDEFLGAWILSPKDYPLSYSIFLFAAFSCSAILNWALGNIKNHIKLTFILVGIFLGSIVNICLIIFGFIQVVDFIYVIFLSILFAFFQIFQSFIQLEWLIPEWIIQIDWIEILLKCFLLVGLGVLFNSLNKKLDNNQDKLLLAILIITLPLLPLVILPLLGSWIGDKLSSVNRESFSPVKKNLLAITNLVLVIFCFIWIIKSYHLPGLIISPNLRHIWGNTNFNEPYEAYEEATKKISDCQLIKKEIGEIKSLALVEGKNYIMSDFSGGGEAARLIIQLIGENKQAIVKGCYGYSTPGTGCAFHLYSLIKENENKAKIYSETGVKIIEILECL